MLEVLEGVVQRNSHPEVFCTKSVLKNFAKFTGKHLCQGLFCNKIANFRPATLLRKTLWYRCFPVDFAKFLRARFFTEHLKPVAASEVYFSSHQRNIVCEYKLHGKPTMR